MLIHGDMRRLEWLEVKTDEQTATHTHHGMRLLPERRSTISAPLPIIPKHSGLRPCVRGMERRSIVIQTVTALPVVGHLILQEFGTQP
ncbi:hypothetical protein, partial [Acidiphilium sp. 34-64-41]|uniref:hypothetical protein n=1 Tax=Acidiphilium sp. 34-64-41 TaxID=1970297 RepID=UPI00257DCCBE